MCDDLTFLVQKPLASHTVEAIGGLKLCPWAAHHPGRRGKERKCRACPTRLSLESWTWGKRSRDSDSQTVGVGVWLGLWPSA